MFYADTILSQWRSLIGHLEVRDQAGAIQIDGQSLDIASVVSIARYRKFACLADSVVPKIQEGVEVVQNVLEQGKVIYGVNTGFGGSADTRILEMDNIQNRIIQELHCGVLMSQPLLDDSLAEKATSTRNQGYEYGPLPLNDAPTCMPEAWTRASMIIRVNSLSRGHSGVRLVLIQSILDLLNNNIIPQIPLRGSISASGDLMPLSYIAGTIQGDSNIRVWTGSNRRTTSADIALSEASLSPVVLGPKEGLSIVNGTACSAGVAALVIQEINSLFVLSQILTSMSVEALLGTRESFDPLFSKVRPHPGQIEAARNIYSFLAGSKLAKLHNSDLSSNEGSLYQDRYSIRTASQWIGPIMEDLQLAFQQVSIECNASTDNPLVDTSGSGRILNGGNFQAKAVTSAMEKIRQGVQGMGQMIFTQCTELMNPRLNRGLPPNLAADEPSQSWLLKPLDIMAAALQSELSFLSNPVSHVQPAEMGNQSLNSLALISARYSHTACNVLSQLASAHLLALCQALDLRAMNVQFLQTIEPLLATFTTKLLGTPGILREINGTEKVELLWDTIWNRFKRMLDETVTMESSSRFSHIFKALQPVLLEVTDSVVCVRGWAEGCSKLALNCYIENKRGYCGKADASPVLGMASYKMYKFVRQELGVPFLHMEARDGRSGSLITVGECVSIIYEAIRNGKLFTPVMESLNEIQ